MESIVPGEKTNSYYKSKLRKLVFDIRKDYLLYLMIIPGIAYILIFKYWPMYGITIAFRDYSIFKGFENAPWIGLEHFISLFNKVGFTRALKNNFIISFQKLLLGFPLPIILSLLINELRNIKYKKFIQTVVILPNFVSWVVINGLLFAMFSINSGVIKGIWEFLGITKELPNILGNKDTFRMVILFSYIWKGLGMGTIVYLAAISSVDPQLYEAAIIDGAGKLKQIWHITLASIRPVIVILLIFRVGQVMDAGFDQIFAISNTLVISVSEIIDTYVYKLGLIQRSYSLATAAGLFKSLIGLTLVLTANYVSKKIDEDSGIM